MVYSGIYPVDGAKYDELREALSGIYWTAYNKGKVIEKGQEYIITGIEGNKLIVNLKED